jgi:hypothetical protein
MGTEKLIGVVFRKGNTTYIPFPDFTLAITDQGNISTLLALPEDLKETPVGDDNNGHTPTSIREIIKVSYMIFKKITEKPLV